ncbi:MAG: hypothetical protein IKH28_01550 [Lachnospiraceae bacterium]|nr:hypothetical protein [Lachnospiraceae bacterium]
MTILGTWCLFMALAGAGNLVLSYKQKKRRFLVYSVLLIAVGSIGLQLVRNTFDGIALPLPKSGFAVILAGATVVAVVTTIRNVRFHRMHITPLSIQESFEKLTEGLCYYRAGGQCILVNGRMQQISRELMGHALLNGEEFAEFAFESGKKVENNDGGANRESEEGENSAKIGESARSETNARTGQIITLRDGRVKEFSERKVIFEKEEATELVAADVTDLFEKTKRLQAENERLRAFQKSLLELHTAQMDTVRREEILKAKMSIHDEMNRLLLSTRNAMQSKDSSEKQKAVMAWKSNALLLCREAQSAASVKEAMSDLGVVAASLGISLDMQDTPHIVGENALGLFVLATREAMVNAVKHADAKKLIIHIAEATSQTEGVGQETSAQTEENGKRETPTQIEESGNKESVNGNTDKVSNASDRNLRNFWIITYENDGKVPVGPVQEAGGLANLRQKLEQADGSMEVEAQPHFRLTVRFPDIQDKT